MLLIRKKMVVGIATVLGILLTSCTASVPENLSYSEDVNATQKDNAGEYSIIYGIPPKCGVLADAPESLVFTRIDDARTADLSSRLLVGGPCIYPSKINISPGPHEIEIMYVRKGTPGEKYVIVEVDVKRSSIYDLKRIVSGYSVEFAAVIREYADH